MVTKYRLDNGLTVILEPIPGAVSVSAGLWVLAGSRDENPDQYGYAHFVEHMLFKGTEKYSARDIARLVDRVGGQHNAATNREYTCYYINLVYDHIELALEILSDMYYNSAFDPAELGKEKNVIIEEIRMYEDTPDEYIHDLFIENMLSGHPLSHSILGTEESIAGARSETLVGFYRGHYRNPNAIFVIAGNFIEDRARGLVEKYFSADGTRGPIPGRDAVRTARRAGHTHSDRDIEQIHFCLGTEGIKRDDEDRWALYALSTIFGGSMSSRLFQNIREKEGLSYSVYSFHSSFSDNGVFGIYCATSPENFGRTLDLILRECRDLIVSGVTGEELGDAKTFMKGNLALSMESIEVRMAQLAKNEITYGRYFSFDDIMREINNISLDDFHRIGDRLFRDKNLSLVTLGRLDAEKMAFNLQI